MNGTAWKCGNRACKEVLGEVVQLKRNGVRIDILRVGNVELEGFGRVKCPVCGTVRAWVPGEEHLYQVLERLDTQKETDMSISNNSQYGK